MIDFDEAVKYLWLAAVALVGAVTGFFTKTRKLPESGKLRLFILGVTTSMFISYITYELVMYFSNANGLSVALAGLASFTGTDFTVTLEKAFIEFIERKFKSL